MFAATLSLVLAAPAEYPKPTPSKDDEPLAKELSPAKAAAYLDAVAVNWTRDRKCVTCHTNMPYLTARPLLPGDAGWKEVRAFLETDVGSWAAGGKPRGDAYVVATAFALAFNDAATTGELHPATKAALDRMWTSQRKTGEWNWLKCDWPPLEHDDYYGAALAALAVGLAPGGYAKTDAAAGGVKKLQAYFAKTPAPDLHHKAMLLWASQGVDGLMTADARKTAVAELKAKQRADGGWCLPSLGEYRRRDKTGNDPDAPSDGYGTGFVVYVLRQAGVGADDPAVAKGVAWLKANQRASGRWYTRSLNNDAAHFITNAGSAFCVLALDACGEKLGKK
jgi:squalene-hopene/tetraprenyl-beta-curcumene cyclase